MGEIENRTIKISSKALGKLEQSQVVTDWIIENKEGFVKLLEGYDELVNKLNQIPCGSQLLDVMPKTKTLKIVLQSRPLPSLSDMAMGNYGYALLEARKPMLYGQNIKNGVISNPTRADESFAIGTPSMQTTKKSLAIGTAGHLAERTFFQWARKQGLEPDGGWEKDDWLQALDEALMLLLAEGEKPLLKDIFVKQNNEGGLGWLTNEKVNIFKEKVTPLLK